MLIGNFQHWDAYVTETDASEKLLKKCGVFDLKGSTLGLQARSCNNRSPCPVLVSLYAKLGLHRYNLLQGTKFEVSHVKKYVFSTGAAAASYYITLDAMDPALGSSSLQTFQTKVSEEAFGRFVLTCNIARIRGEPSNDGSGMNIACLLPECPPENPFEIYNLMKDSELQGNDWIRLYLDLAVATTDRNREANDFGISNLEIVNVAVDANDDKNAVFYIRYKDLYKARCCEDDFDRIAIVRRTFNEDTKCFFFMGQNQSADVIPKKRKIGFSLKGHNQSSETILN